jgi:hypothetical protein
MMSRVDTRNYRIFALGALFAGALGVVVACGSPARTAEGEANDGGPGESTVSDSGRRDASLSDGARDSNISLFPDGSAFDGTPSEAGACRSLNIGIFGNPGVNAASDFQAWLVSAGTSVQRIQTMAPTPTITAATLQPFDVVILDWLMCDYTVSEASVFAAFVSAGGGAISMSGYDGNTTDDWHANSLLAPLQVA